MSSSSFRPPPKMFPQNPPALLLRLLRRRGDALAHHPVRGNHRRGGLRPRARPRGRRPGDVDHRRLRGLRRGDASEHDGDALDDSQEKSAKRGGTTGGGEAVAQLQHAAGERAGHDRVPGVLLSSDGDEGAVEGAEKTAPDGEGTADLGRLASDRLQAAGEAVALGRVVEALHQVHRAAADGAHGERAADVIEDAVRAGLAPVGRRCAGEAIVRSGTTGGRYGTGRGTNRGAEQNTRGREGRERKRRTRGPRRTSLRVTRSIPASGRRARRCPRTEAPPRRRLGGGVSLTRVARWGRRGPQIFRWGRNLESQTMDLRSDLAPPTTVDALRFLRLDIFYPANRDRSRPVARPVGTSRRTRAP